MASTMNTAITSEVVTFLREAKPAPKRVKAKAIDHIIDGVGLMLAGSRRPCTRKVVEYVRDVGGRPAATLLGFAEKAPTANAALVNGTSGHADDYDDTQLSTSPDRIYGLLTHPTVPVLAAALAVGEDRDCSGAAFLDAFIAGFEVECKLAEAIRPAHYRKGFHTTGTIGAFGACAAASSSWGLVRSESSVREAQVTSSGPKAPLPTLSIVPAPSISEPDQVTDAVRSAISSLLPP